MTEFAHGETASDGTRLVVIPQWDLTDHMRKAMRHARLGPGEMAARVGVSPGTVTNWINGRTNPSKAALMVWAQVTGVDYDWLVSGLNGPHVGEVRRQGLEPRTRWLMPSAWRSGPFSPAGVKAA